MTFVVAFGLDLTLQPSRRSGTMYERCTTFALDRDTGMEITDLDWDEENLSHIQRHRVSPDEVEEVLFLKPWVRRSRQDRYLGLGQALSGRYLFVVFEYLGHGRARTITARDQERRERRAYLDWMGE